MKDNSAELEGILKSIDTLWQTHPHLQADFFIILAYTIENPEEYGVSFMKTCHRIIAIYQGDNKSQTSTQADMIWDEDNMSLLKSFLEKNQTIEVMKKIGKLYPNAPEGFKETEIRLIDQCQKEKKAHDDLKSIIMDTQLSVESKAERLFHTEHGIDHTIYNDVLRSLLEKAEENLTKADALRLKKIFNQYAGYHRIERIVLNPFDRFINIIQGFDDSFSVDLETEIDAILSNTSEIQRLANSNFLPIDEVLNKLYLIKMNASYLSPSFRPDNSFFTDLDQLGESPLYILRNRINHDSEITIEEIITEIERILEDPFECHRIASRTSVRHIIDLTSDQVKDHLRALIRILQSSENSIGLELGMMILGSPCIARDSESMELTNFSDFKEIFNLLILRPDDILRALECTPKNEPNFFKNLFQSAIQNPEERNQLFPSHVEFMRFVKNCLDVDLRTTLVVEVIQNKDERQSLIDNYSMLKVIFKRISPNNSLIDFRTTAAEVIEDSVLSPETFKHWFKTPEDFNLAKQDFPNHPVFMLNTLAEAIEVVAEMADIRDQREIERASRVMSMNGMDGRFFSPPREIRAKILKHLSTDESPRSKENASNSAEATVLTRKWEQLSHMSPDELREKLQNSDEKYREDIRETLVRAQSDIVESQNKRFAVKEGLSEHIDSLKSVLDDFSIRDNPQK